LKTLISDKENFVKNLIFVDDKKQADFVFERLISDFPELGVIHSNKSQNFRFNAIKNFEKGKITSLIATDVVARGLDFKDISHVINLSPPEVPGDYIHRIGRTGRAGKDGASIMMIAPYEEDQYSNIRQIAGANVREIDLPQKITTVKILMEFEKPANLQKAIVKSPELSKGGGAFHTKSEKNQKTNSGSVKQRMKKKRR
jgi:ATP-dependent RNA helicase RhlE